jgi:lycopene beta-cyclase
VSLIDADVAVVGAGPAGLALAAAIAGVGLRVVIVAPEPEARWPATYGVWAHELGPLGLDDHVRARWDGVRVHGTRPHDLAVPYALLDNDAVAGALRARVQNAGGRMIAGRAVDVQHFRWGSRLMVDTGHGREVLDSAIVFDAAGSTPALASRPRGRVAVQSAVGIVARFERPPAAPGSCVLMDWRGVPDGDPDPTFLYAMDLGDGTWLAEETSLARRPALGADELRRRLVQRLAALGTPPVEVRAEERVAIEMGCRPPGAGQAVVAFGAAAGLVHPATGYSVGLSLRLAPVVAREVAAALARRAGAPAVVQAAGSAVWPAWRRRARHLELYGLEALLRLRAGETREFFDAFTELPPERWHGYLAGTLSAAGVARTMAEVFSRVPGPVRVRLAAGSPVPLLRAVTG